MAPQALIFLLSGSVERQPVHCLEADITELEFYDSPQIKLTLKDLWFLNYHMYKRLINTGDPKRSS